MRTVPFIFVPSGLFLVRTWSSVILNPWSLLRPKARHITLVSPRESLIKHEFANRLHTFHSHSLVIRNRYLGQTALLQFRLPIHIQANFFIQHCCLAEVSKSRDIGQLQMVINDDLSTILRLDFRDWNEGERSRCASQRNCRVERVDPWMIAAVCSESLCLVKIK